ncbi:hypothetical protein C3B44_03770 [Corynebacterium yudongzhengii]|uniref:Oxidoreductase n=1 Tax=Corynebacterium yudongzhengii TaxID=2080740 RepID=A0A2U1T6F2_9CORY|nr:hypothetical protein [Corynebacterium yudongzhengii]AWB81587.1 hypothetical protein C3B44_03770 [Corynebacterium yudongzhengii]PWC01572.1 hypothetical protein DF222_06430 [Corynebacterium yudongzhengii]
MSLRSRRTRIPLATATTAALLAVAACAPDPAADDAPLDQPVGLPIDAPKVTLIDAGDNPSDTLTYTDVDADEQAVTVTVADGFAQSIESLDSLETEAPEGQLGGGTQMVLPLSGATAKASEPDEGQREATRAPEYRLGSATVDDQALLPELRSAEGFRVGWRGDDSGEISTVMLSAPEAASDEGRAAVEGALMKMLSLPVIFPSEPVGPGAQWEVNTRVAGDASLLRTITYRLEEIGENTVELSVDVAERPTLGALSLEGAPGAEDLEETELTLENSDTAARGNLTVDLSSALPVDGQVDITTRVIYSGADQAVVQDSSVSLGFDTDAEA